MFNTSTRRPYTLKWAVIPSDEPLLASSAKYDEPLLFVPLFLQRQEEEAAAGERRRRVVGMEEVVGVWHVTWPWRKGRRIQRGLRRAKKKKARARMLHMPPCSQEVAYCLFKGIRVSYALKH